MNNDSYRQVEMQINLKEVIWDLLSQWKAVLIASLIMMLLVTSAKYYKDSKTIKAVKEKTGTETALHLTKEERIQQAKKNVPKAERDAVDYYVSRQLWIIWQKEYLSKSILMNLDPSNERHLSVNYSIVADEDDIPALKSNYDLMSTSQLMIDKIKPIIDPDKEDRYIEELISSNILTQNNVSKNYSNGIFTITITVPDGIDADELESAIDEAVNDIKKTNEKEIAAHSIIKTGSKDTTVVNAQNIEDRADYHIKVYNAQTALKNEQSNLSSEQKKAIETIVGIYEGKESQGAKNTTRNDNNRGSAKTTAVKNIGISKKYALFGFVMGAMAYAFIYLIMIIVRARINYACDAETYTHSRLLGETYEHLDHKGVESLLHSKIVDKYRYRNKADADLQDAKIIDALTAVCEHAGVHEATLYNMAGSDKAALIERLQKEMDEQGIKLNPTEAMGDVDERSLLSVENAVFVVSPETGISYAANMADLCRNYDVQTLGTIFAGSI